MMIRRIFALLFSIFFMLGLSPRLLAQDEAILREILRSYTRSLGELVETRNLKSFRIKGTTFQQSQELNFVMYKKAPNLLRYEIIQDGHEVVQVFDGKKGWQWSPETPEVAPVALSREQQNFLKREANFHSPLMNYEREGMELVYVGRESIRSNINPVFHLRLKGGRSGVEMDIYLDIRTYYEVKRETKLPSDGAVLETLFSDYEKVKGFPVPFTVRNYVNGELVSRTKVEEVDLNVGVLSFYFNKPTFPKSR